jgi:hypothetical protein
MGGQWQKWIAKAPELDRPHPNALQEKFYWCTVIPNVYHVYRLRSEDAGRFRT